LLGTGCADDKKTWAPAPLRFALAARTLVLVKDGWTGVASLSLWNRFQQRVTNSARIREIPAPRGKPAQAGMRRAGGIRPAWPGCAQGGRWKIVRAACCRIESVWGACHVSLLLLSISVNQPLRWRCI